MSNITAISIINRCQQKNILVSNQSFKVEENTGWYLQTLHLQNMEKFYMSLNSPAEFAGWQTGNPAASIGTGVTEQYVDVVAVRLHL